MTTTSSLQKLPDFYHTKQECDRDSKIKMRTNDRYAGFDQRIFTAGDEEQFQRFRDPTNGDVSMPYISMESNIHKLDNDSYVWDKYKNLGVVDVENTFHYIFNKFKKGIFVKIKDNKLSVFLPFSNANFVNEWGDKIAHDPSKYHTMDEFLSYVSSMQGYRYHPSKTQQDTSKWYANNHLLRSEYPIAEGDNNVNNVKHMFETLCKDRIVPDIELFINRRDYPLLMKDGTETYTSIWGEGQKLVSHSYDKYVPILSMSTTDKHADVLMPTWEDWASTQNVVFPGSCKDYNTVFDVPWSSKKDIAVFRGTTTGEGTTTKDNMRIKVSEMDKNNSEYINAGITKWNVRPRKKKDSKYLDTIHIKDMSFGLKQFMSPYEQSKYKYIIHIQGHVEAFRLEQELSMGSVILKVDTPWKTWYTPMLKEYVHYVPIKSDLSNLIDQIKWCRNNDAKCKEITENAKIFHDTYITSDSLLDYMQIMLYTLKKNIGVYLYTKNPITTNIYESEIILPFHPKTNKTLKNIGTIPHIARSYGLLEGIRSIVSLCGDSFPEASRQHKKIFSNKTSTITSCLIAGFMVVIKSTKDETKKLEHIHENFIGQRGINMMIKDIPNFAYILGMFGDCNLVIEYIHGVVMSDYMKSSSFTIKEYVLIMLQLCLALEMAQQRIGLVHWDLKPWNIMIQKLPKFVSFDYIVNHKVYRIKTNIVPVIIDYGKSHIIYENVHHGLINPFQTSGIQDVLTLLTSSLNQMQGDNDDLLYIANFISGTKYRKEPFVSVDEMRIFMNNAKKYTNLTNQPKYDLENKSTFDMFKYLMKRFKLQVKMPDHFKSNMNKGNGHQVFDYILASNNDERIASYYDVCSRLCLSTIPQPKNKFLVYLAAQQIYQGIYDVFDMFKKYIKSGDNHPIFQNTLEFINKVYLPLLSKPESGKLLYNTENMYDSLEKVQYDINIFSHPDDVISILNEELIHDMVLTSHIDSVLLFKGHFEMSESDLEFYINDLKDVMKINRFNNLTSLANYRTLEHIGKLVYTHDIQELENKLEIKNKNANYDVAEKNLNYYKQFIKSC
jgi:hypothetical protein